MEDFRPLLEVLVQPTVAAALGGALAFWLVARLKAWRPGLSVNVKVFAAVATSAVAGLAQEALRALADGDGFRWQKLVAYIAGVLVTSTLGHLAVSAPKARAAEEAELVENIGAAIADLERPGIGVNPIPPSVPAPPAGGHLIRPDLADVPDLPEPTSEDDSPHKL